MSLLAKRPKKICIIGAGVAGLASAIFLQKAGFEVVLCERAKEVGLGGYAFLLLANGLAVLEKAGLMGQILHQGDLINRLVLNNELGATVSINEVEEAICIRRTYLCNILRNQLPRNIIYSQYHFTHFEHDENGVATHACFANGAKIGADLFIGADGTRSLIRSLVDPDFKMPKGRVKELVSFLPAMPPIKNTLVKFQHSAGCLAAGYVPMGKDTVNWYMQFDSHLWDLNEKSDKKAFAQKLIGHYPEPLATFVRNTDFSHSHLWNTSNMRILPKFYNKNILLIGDAAHTFSPFSSQGVNSALQDASVLTEMLGKSESLTDSLTFYAEQRLPSIRTLMKAGEDMINTFLSPYAKPFIPLALERG